MKATIITIGDEILIGQIVDTNSAWMGQQLNNVGVSVYEIITINDDREHILSAFAKAEQQSDLVLITGGLGPTKDDVTKSTICAYFDDELIMNKEVLEHIENIFSKYVKDAILPANRDQALVPSKARILPNDYGTAPGLWMEKNDTIFVSMPGVPFEMKGIMTSGVLPEITKKGNLPFIHHRTMITAGVGESTIAKRIEDWESALPKTIKLAYLPSSGMVRLRLSSTGMNRVEVETSVAVQVKALYELIGDIIVGESNGESLVHSVFHLLKEKGKTIATAESCTGGKIANLITEIPGASYVFKGSTITYATQSKIDILGVEENLIDKCSVVSAEVATAMAAQARVKFKSDIAIATTGNAGPSKGDSDAEVGTVYIGIADENGAMAHKFLMGNNRERVVQKTVNKSLELLQKILIKK